MQGVGDGKVDCVGLSLRLVDTQVVAQALQRVLDDGMPAERSFAEANACPKKSKEARSKKQLLK